MGPDRWTRPRGSRNIAGLLIACAHAWEAAPFVQTLGLRAAAVDYLPFPLYQGGDSTLLLTGTGRARASLAVGVWLSHRLRDLRTASGSGLHAPPLLVANFGTAGARQSDWPIGQTLLIHRVRDGEGESHYPERLVVWPGEETECRTVGSPETGAPADQRGRPVFDMEAFGVAEAVTTFLSSSHLVVGKCVSDHLGIDALGDWKALASRCEKSYQEGAACFLEHARDHLAALMGDQRRQRSRQLKTAVEDLLALACEALPLTVAQQRELTQAVRARLAACQTEAEHGQEVERVKGLLAGLTAADKNEGKKALALLLEAIRQSQRF